MRKTTTAGMIPARDVAGPDEGTFASDLRAVLREPLAWGVALVIFLRPWVDGLTYPTFNTYYLWAIIVLTALWGARLLLRGEPLRHRVPIALLAAFVLIAFLTGLGTVQVNATYRSVLFWCGHFFLFLLCTNGLRTVRAQNIVLAALIVSVGANAIWSLIHYEWLLPMMREELNRNPGLLAAQFGTEVLTPELRHRLEVNRAFGTFIFPNALAAFLVLMIPLLAGVLRSAYVNWRWTKGAQAVHDTGRLPAVVFLAIWLSTASAAFFLYPFLLLVIARDADYFARPVQATFWLGIVPLALAAAGFWYVRTRGWRPFALVVANVAAAVALVASVWALYLTFSRGGWLALVVACVVGMILYAKGSPNPWVWNLGSKRAPGAAVCWLLMAGVALASVAQGRAPEEDALAAVETAAELTPVGNNEALAIEGMDIGAAELSDPASAQLRVSYWRVASRIIRDHFWSGVGLGNFGAVYANYQRLGDGPVQMAHNDYLQVFTETGVFGLLAFLAMWGYFAVWGGLRITRETDSLRRGIITGMYAGVLAFLMHAFIDFDFQNPSLVALIVTVAGLFYARAGLRGDAVEVVEERRAVSQMIAIPILLAVALVTSAALRVYIFEFTLTEGSLVERAMRVGDRSGLRQRIALGRFLLDEVPKLPPPAPGQQRQIPTRFLQDLAQLIPNLEDIKRMGSVRVPIGADRSAHRPLREGEPPPPNAFVAITDPRAAQEVAVKWSEQELQFLELAHAIFPHDPEVTQTLFEWYDMLQMAVQDPDQRRAYLDESVKWAQAAVAANPRQAWPHQWLGKALMFRGSMERGASSTDYYEEGIEQFEIAAELFPISPMTWSQLGQWQQKLGESYQKVGQEKRAATLIARGEDALGEAKRLELEEFKRTRPYKWQRMPKQQELLEELTRRAREAGR